MAAARTNIAHIWAAFKRQLRRELPSRGARQSTFDPTNSIAPGAAPSPDGRGDANDTTFLTQARTAVTRKAGIDPFLSFPISPVRAENTRKRA